MHRTTGRSQRLLRVVLPCFISQSVTTGFIMGSFGPLLVATQQHFGISRAIAATGLSAFNLSLALLSPLIGGLLQKTSARVTMMIAAVLSAVGYLGLALLPSFTLALSMYALLGASAAVLSILGPVTLISRWFVEGRNRMLGIVNLPIMMLIAPAVIGALLPHFGRSFVLLGMAACFLLILPFFALISEQPGHDPAEASRHASLQAHAPVAPPLSSRQILSNPSFWLISVAVGITVASTAAFFVHIVPFGVARHMSLQTAASLLSIFALFGVPGTLLFGWAADRFGGIAAFACSAICQSLLWMAMLQMHGPDLFLVAALLGACGLPLNTLHAASINELVPVASVSRAMGLSYAIKLPFLIGGPPCTALLFEINKDYTLPFMVAAVGLLLAAILFMVTRIVMKKERLRDDTRPGPRMKVTRVATS